MIVKISELEVGMDLDGTKRFISAIGGSLIVTLERANEEIIETIYRSQKTGEIDISIDYFCSETIKKNSEGYIEMDKKLTKWEGK